MSFSLDIKHEIANNKYDECCRKAILAAIFQIKGNLKIKNNRFEPGIKSESVTLARLFFTYYNDLYEKKIKLDVTRKSKLKKNEVFDLNIDEDAKKIYQDLGLYNASKSFQEVPFKKILRKQCCKKGYIAGCFLACGQCNGPESKYYHLELSFDSLKQAAYLKQLLMEFNINTKISERRNKHVIYIKKSESIADFLRLINASNALLAFEDKRIIKDMYISTIRLSNIDTLNYRKTLKSANDQLKAINFLKQSKQYTNLDNKYKEIIDLRLKHPDEALLELCSIYLKEYNQVISKSGIKHRFNKIMELAKKEGYETDND